jgi:hypothetical protein
MRLAEVATPADSACSTPSLAARQAPKSSQFTMSARAGMAAPPRGERSRLTGRALHARSEGLRSSAPGGPQRASSGSRYSAVALKTPCIITEAA